MNIISLKGSDSPSFTAVTPSLDLLGTAFGNLDHSVVHQPIKSAPLSSRFFLFLFLVFIFYYY